MADSQSPEPVSNYEKVVERARSQTPETQHTLRSEMFGAYTAFVGAALLVFVTNAAAIGAALHRRSGPRPQQINSATATRSATKRGADLDQE